MATIKSYSDLQQSKKLAEILPLESADQTLARIAIAGANLDVPEELQYRHNGDMPFKYYSGIGTPCWSLASLLGILPEIQGGKPVIALDDNYITYPHMSDLNTKSDNLVDACVAMVGKLNELNLI